MFIKSVLRALLVWLLVFAALGSVYRTHRRHLRAAAEAGLRHEIQDNLAGVRDMRGALVSESRDMEDAADLLQARANGRSDASSPLHLGLAVMSFTDANWRAATSTRAVETMEYGSVARYAGAYFEQARLAQLQASTLESMMSLQSYVGRGDHLASLTPEHAQSAVIQARLLAAHLRTMSRMAEGVQDAYEVALGTRKA